MSSEVVSLIAFIDLLNSHIPAGSIVEILRDKNFYKFKEGWDTRNGKVYLYERSLRFLRDNCGDSEVSTICREALEGKSDLLENLGTETLVAERLPTPIIPVRRVDAIPPNNKELTEHPTVKRGRGRPPK